MVVGVVVEAGLVTVWVTVGIVNVVVAQFSAVSPAMVATPLPSTATVCDGVDAVTHTATVAVDVSATATADAPPRAATRTAARATRRRNYLR